MLPVLRVGFSGSPAPAAMEPPPVAGSDSPDQPGARRNRNPVVDRHYTTQLKHYYMNSNVAAASRVPQGHGKLERSEDFEDVALVQGGSCGSAGPAPEGDDARRVRPRRMVECRHWVREALADILGGAN